MGHWSQRFWHRFAQSLAVWVLFAAPVVALLWLLGLDPPNGWAPLAFIVGCASVAGSLVMAAKSRPGAAVLWGDRGRRASTR